MSRINVSMAEMLSCWKVNTGQPDDNVLPAEKAHEFFSYALENMDMMIEQVRQKRENSQKEKDIPATDENI